MSSSATSTAFGMVSIVLVVKRRKVIFALIMRTVLLGAGVGFRAGRGGGGMRRKKSRLKIEPFSEDALRRRY